MLAPWPDIPPAKRKLTEIEQKGTGKTKVSKGPPIANPDQQSSDSAMVCSVKASVQLRRL
jgi:hypothetical protein